MKSSARFQRNPVVTDEYTTIGATRIRPVDQEPASQDWSLVRLFQSLWRGQLFRDKICFSRRRWFLCPGARGFAAMMTCERCGTENLDGSRYCDECGAAMWLAGRASDLTRVPEQPNGSNRNGRREASKTVAQSVRGAGQPAMSERQTSSPLVAPDRKVHAVLVIERGSSAGKQFSLSDENSNIGRWDAEGGVFPDVDLDSDDPEAKVSRRHARISRRDGQYAIEDLGSTNGTFVNRGRRLVPGNSQPLQDGDEIIVGKTFLRFRVAK
jgi:hypothetical protein